VVEVPVNAAELWSRAGSAWRAVAWALVPVYLIVPLLCI
jgi:hypothetical protein